MLTHSHPVAPGRESLRASATEHEHAEADRLATARDLASRVEALLGTPPSGADAPELFRHRLARAHVLGLLDQLDEMLAQHPLNGLHPH